MRHPLKTYSRLLLFVFISGFFISCKDKQKTTSVASGPTDMQSKVHKLISDVTGNGFKDPDSIAAAAERHTSKQIRLEQLEGSLA